MEHLEQIKLKDDLKAKALRTKDRDDWIRAQKSRNFTKAMMKQAKSAYLTDALPTDKNDSKQFWRTLDKILPLGKVRPNAP